MALGKYSLNLFKFPGHAMVESLYQLLENLLTKVFFACSVYWLLHLHLSHATAVFLVTHDSGQHEFLEVYSQKGL